MGVFLEGLIAAVHTPMAADGRINLQAIEKQAAALVDQGVNGAFVCGSTGEASSLTVSERMAVLERWQTVCRGELLVIAHVGQTNPRDARDLAAHAASQGVHAVAITGPTVLVPRDESELVAFCRPIAEAAGQLPVYYYHTPKVISAGVDLLRFLEAATAAIPNLAGVKFNDVDLGLYQQCLDLDGGGLDISYAVDEMMLGALAVGARSAVGSTYNYAASIFLEMMQSFAAGDLDTARASSRRSLQLVACLQRHGVLASGKAMMALHGVDCGPPRAPVAPLNPAAREWLLDQGRALLTSPVAKPVTAQV